MNDWLSAKEDAQISGLGSVLVQILNSQGQHICYFL